MFDSPECGVMNAAAGLMEPGLQPRGLKPGALWDTTLEPPEFWTPFSPPVDTRNWASGGRSDGA